MNSSGMNLAEEDNPAIGMAYEGRQDSMLNKYGSFKSE